jgi:hypothetical protein
MADRQDGIFDALDGADPSDGICYAAGPEGEAARRDYEGGRARQGAASGQPGRPRRRAAEQCDATRQAAMHPETWLPRSVPPPPPHTHTHQKTPQTKCLTGLGSRTF